MMISSNNWWNGDEGIETGKRWKPVKGVGKWAGYLCRPLGLSPIGGLWERVWNMLMHCPTEGKGSQVFDTQIFIRNWLWVIPGAFTTPTMPTCILSQSILLWLKKALRQWATGVFSQKPMEYVNGTNSIYPKDGRCKDWVWWICIWTNSLPEILYYMFTYCSLLTNLAL